MLIVFHYCKNIVSCMIKSSQSQYGSIEQLKFFLWLFDKSLGIFLRLFEKIHNFLPQYDQLKKFSILLHILLTKFVIFQGWFLMQFMLYYFIYLLIFIHSSDANCDIFQNSQCFSLQIVDDVATNWKTLFPWS